MRSHAKASTAGSTQRQAKGLGHIFRGVFATRGASLDVKGSSAPSARRLVLPAGVLAAIVATMALVVSPAAASKTHLFKEAFGPAAQPSFNGARGIAVDQSSGDVLVMDAAAPASIKRYNADGTADSFPATGTNAIDGSGTGDETPQSGLSFAASSESQIAVDNSGGATDGNIYVTQSSPNLINVFSDEGAYLGQLTAAGATPFSEACGVAVDPSGTVYVGDYSGGIHKFVPAANPPVNADNTATFTTVTNPCTLAAGAGASTGFLFAAQYIGPISKLDSGTGEVKYVVSPASYRTVTVDPGSGHVYAATTSSDAVEEFDASGAGGASSISSFTGPTQGAGQGVAVRSSTGEIYVSRGGTATKLEIFDLLVTLPDVTTEAASSIDETTATLNGAVNPDGVELSECFFEYGKAVSYGQSAPCAQSPATIGSGTSNVAVSADISGLELGAEYHFRLVAKNTNGTVNGADETFKLMSPPVIKEEWAASVVFSEATLKAKINPEGFATTYKVEWGTTASYGEETAAKGAGSDKADHVVSAFLDGLQPGTTYHYRVTATNSIGTAVGPDRSFTTYAPFVSDPSCPNLAFRIGESAALPDCRAYEMVSPVDKNGGDIRGGNTAANLQALFYQSALSGDRITYSSHMPFGDAPGGHYSNQYLASRGPEGWTTHGIGAPQDTTIFDPVFAPFLELDTQLEMFSEDLSSAWLRDFNKVPLTPEGIAGYANLYREDTATGAFEALTVNAPLSPTDKTLSEQVCCESAQVEGASSDGSRAVISAAAQLTPDAKPGTNQQLYEYHDGELELVSVLPGGTANPTDSHVGSFTAVTFAGSRFLALRTHAVSDDGSRIFWTAEPAGGNEGVEYGKIYARIDGETTVPVSESEGSRFWAASPDGSQALFTVGKTPASTTLFVSDVDAEAATPIAGGVYGVLGASDDLDYVYFISSEDLDTGATAGQRNLYLYRNGTISFVATVSAVDTYEPTAAPGPTEASGYSIVSPAGIQHASRVTPDGRRIAFQSIASLTGYDNTAENGRPAVEVFTYDADSAELICASCNPSGARPITQPYWRPFGIEPLDEFGGVRATAAWLTTSPHANYTPRALPEDGNRLFFNAFDALVPHDTNGAQDVYQWEAQGSGGCEKPKGCISLISTGQSAKKSEFVDASAGGRDVFFTTSSSIHPDDPGLIDLYDARMGGGYPLPPAPTPCLGDACQSVPPAPSDPTPASAGFRGAGDPKPRAAKRRRCATRKRAGKAKSQAKRTKAKRCKRAKRGAGR